ncbi:MAG: YihA family ribosome biogenesis GTP-binding protein, partial [Paludibacteraceae bacterium]|nr:YihA family ribosome biogenesis GTP-binding protein [Paludibacteraceae bacterium]
FSIIFTKIDKLSQSQLNNNLKKYHDKLFETWEELPPMFATSSERRIGIDDVLDYIEQINEEFKKAKQ